MAYKMKGWSGYQDSPFKNDLTDEEKLQRAAKLKRELRYMPLEEDSDDGKAIKKLKEGLKIKEQKKSIVPIISAKGTITKKGSQGGGFVGLHKPTKWGGVTIGAGGGGASSKKYDWKGEGYKFGPSFGVNIKLGKKKKK